MQQTKQYKPSLNNKFYWELIPAIKIFQKFIQIKPYKTNILSIDLDGGEWTALKFFTETKQMCKILRDYEKILFRLRYKKDYLKKKRVATNFLKFI